MAVQNNAIRIAYRPAGSTDPWQVLRVTGDSLTTEITTVDSEEVRTDRMLSDSNLTSIDASGSVDIEFTADTFDAMLAAVMHQAFVDGVAKVGTDGIKFDVLKSVTTLDRHVMFKNMVVSEASLSLEEGALISGSLSFQGEDVDATYDPTGDTFKGSTTTATINCNKDIDNATLIFDGASAASQGLYLNSLNISINNSYEAARAIGHIGAVDQSPGQASVTGEVVFHGATASYDLWASQFDNGDHDIAFTFGSGKTGESDYTITLPRVRLTGELPGASTSGLTTISMNYSALRDPATETSLMISKVDDVPAP